MENQNKPFNKLVKLTIWSFVGSVCLYLIAYGHVHSVYNFILDFPFLPWGNESLMSLIYSIVRGSFPFSYFGSMVLLVLTIIFGIIASIQTHKRNERGGVVSLSFIGMAIILIILLFNLI